MTGHIKLQEQRGEPQRSPGSQAWWLTSEGALWGDGDISACLRRVAGNGTHHGHIDPGPTAAKPSVNRSWWETGEQSEMEIQEVKS